jgi:hypothetical protein
VAITHEMRAVVQVIRRKDADMARQLRRSWSSTALNSAEGARQRGAKGLTSVPMTWSKRLRPWL